MAYLDDLKKDKKIKINITNLVNAFICSSNESVERGIIDPDENKLPTFSNQNKDD
tara:strand:- start:186 stop:350 length:165 start_codon:yes stop_codon:yes gene_type:complete